jgi:hypothetical protein
MVTSATFIYIIFGSIMTAKKKEIILPEGVHTMGLSEQEAAKVYGLSPSAFSALDPRFKPRARRAGDRKLFSRIETEEMFHRLPFWDEGSLSDSWSID